MVHVAGALIGLPIGWLLLRSMASAYSTELYRIPLTIRGTTWLLAPACAIIFVGAAHLLVRRALRLSDWRDAINVKE
jgi:ABC-type antimicrobial peptide transport system permease subunit